MVSQANVGTFSSVGPLESQTTPQTSFVAYFCSLSAGNLSPVRVSSQEFTRYHSETDTKAWGLHGAPFKSSTDTTGR